MASNALDLKNTLAASICLMPCTENDLIQRFPQYSKEFIQRFILNLEKDAIYYKGETMYIYKEWAKNNLKDFDVF